MCFVVNLHVHVKGISAYLWLKKNSYNKWIENQILISFNGEPGKKTEYTWDNNAANQGKNMAASVSWKQPEK